MNTKSEFAIVYNSSRANDVPCLKLNPGTFFITISNNTGAYGDLILYFKDHNKNTNVSIGQGNKYNTIKANDNETYTINVAKGTKQIKLSFKTKDNSSKASYIDNIILKAPTSSIATSPDAKLSFNQQEMSAAIGTTYNSSQLLSNPNSLPINGIHLIKPLPQWTRRAMSRLTSLERPPFMPFLKAIIIMLTKLCLTN